LKKLKEMLAFFGQPHRGTKEELIPKLIEFFEEPKPSEKIFRSPEDKKRKNDDDDEPTGGKKKEV